MQINKANKHLGHKCLGYFPSLTWLAAFIYIICPGDHKTKKTSVGERVREATDDESR